MSICPKCKCEYPENRGALSRRDNKTEICPDCGFLEAMEDAQKIIENNKK